MGQAVSLRRSCGMWAFRAHCGGLEPNFGLFWGLKACLGPFGHCKGNDTCIVLSSQHAQWGPYGGIEGESMLDELHWKVLQLFLPRCVFYLEFHVLRMVKLFECSLSCGQVFKDLPDVVSLISHSERVVGGQIVL